MHTFVRGSLDALQITLIQCASKAELNLWSAMKTLLDLLANLMICTKTYIILHKSQKTFCKNQKIISGLLLAVHYCPTLLGWMGFIKKIMIYRSQCLSILYLDQKQKEHSKIMCPRITTMEQLLILGRKGHVRKTINDNKLQ